MQTLLQAGFKDASFYDEVFGQVIQFTYKDYIVVPVRDGALKVIKGSRQKIASSINEVLLIIASF